MPTVKVVEIEAARAAASVPPSPTIVDEDGRPMWCPADAVLTIEQVARILGVAPKTVRATEGLKRAFFSPQRPYVLYRWLVEYLEERSA